MGRNYYPEKYISPSRHTPFYSLVKTPIMTNVEINMVMGD